MVRDNGIKDSKTGENETGTRGLRKQVIYKRKKEIWKSLKCVTDNYQSEKIIGRPSDVISHASSWKNVSDLIDRLFSQNDILTAENTALNKFYSQITADYQREVFFHLVSFIKKTVFVFI